MSTIFPNAPNTVYPVKKTYVVRFALYFTKNLTFCCISLNCTADSP